MIAVKALRRKIMNGTSPHGDPSCGCVLCAMPRGGGWGELQLEERLLWMGGEVHRAMRALGDFVLFGTVQRLPGPGTIAWVSAALPTPTPPAPAAPKVPGTTTVIGIDRDVVPPGSGQSSEIEKHTKTRTLTGPPPVDERLPPYLDDAPIGGMEEIIGGDFVGGEFDRVMDEIMGPGSFDPGLGLRGGYQANIEKLRKSSMYGKTPRPSAGPLLDYARAIAPSRTRVARLSLTYTLTSDERMEYIDASPQRPFKARYLFVSTPENIDIWGIRVGNEEYLNNISPVDAATFWMPNDKKIIEEWDPAAEQRFLERCRLDMSVAMVGMRIRLMVKPRKPSAAGYPFIPFEFRAVLLGQEVVA
jgi:hypothetical protein